MEIKINEEKKISEIQKEFQEMFQFLKIEFAIINGQSNNVSKLCPVNNFKRIGEYKMKKKPASFFIQENITVAEIERNFLANYGLVAEIFRKSGKSWLHATITDDWTLKEQNDHGKALSNFHV